MACFFLNMVSFSGHVVKGETGGLLLFLNMVSFSGHVVKGEMGGLLFLT